ncbi:pyridoxamine 5'-phosphate oxidase family protein [Amycolatopsis sp.]|uniref:pyridoxamine 5'-phosphate oxidase family protein n=1 Tax=Amycolatopsis sp. TaxID=37632 RepID=UPI002BB89EEC|nr:pyridoxamine 5'-phosphate oxidase family protein [Amycolatopsis sp.]HVV08614.1 pyridoxamine 5'-phosphate oxidase family protein [Amycolatopsis sp.]
MGKTGFHEGELAVQRRAGVDTEAGRLAGMLAPADLSGGIGGFLAGRTFAALTARDRDGRLWTVPLTGAPGFLEPAGAGTLLVHTAPEAPLDDLPAGQPVGLLAIEFMKRRRVRVNGTLAATGEVLTIEAEQAYGNCPRYIHPHVVDAAKHARATTRRDALSADDIALIQQADTFILGTTHPERGNDASHRGGEPGFVYVEDEHTLWWADYPGNNLFNSLGNIAVDPTAALLFPDFDSGEALHLSGRATLEWTEHGRLIRFTVEAVAR